MATNTPFKNIHLLTEAQYDAETKSANDIYAVEVPTIDLVKAVSSTSTDSEIPTAKAVNDSFPITDVQQGGVSVVANKVAVVTAPPKIIYH